MSDEWWRSLCQDHIVIRCIHTKVQICYVQQSVHSVSHYSSLNISKTPIDILERHLYMCTWQFSFNSNIMHLVDGRSWTWWMLEFSSSLFCSHCVVLNKSNIYYPLQILMSFSYFILIWCHFDPWLCAFGDVWIVQSQHEASHISSQHFTSSLLWGTSALRSLI